VAALLVRPRPGIRSVVPVNTACKGKSVGALDRLGPTPETLSGYQTPPSCTWKVSEQAEGTSASLKISIADMPPDRLSDASWIATCVAANEA